MRILVRARTVRFAPRPCPTSCFDRCLVACCLLSRCPLEGWQLGYGMTCNAPSSYDGPCPKIIQMAGAGVPEKKTMEVECDVAWRSLGLKCRRDYEAAQCPLGHVD